MTAMAERTESTDVENAEPPAEDRASAAYKMTPERVAKYLAALSNGARRGAAAKAAGVERQTIARWRRLDPDFDYQADQAELDAHEEVEDALYQAAVSGNVTAIQVYLYNRLSDRWRDQRNLQIAGPGGGAIEHVVDHRRYDLLDDAQLAAAEAEAAERLAAEGSAAVAEAEAILARRSPARKPGPRARRSGRSVRAPQGEGPA